jgi:hypothetical protein
LSKEVYTNNERNNLVEEQVYLPLFSESSPNDFVVIKGGKEDVVRVRSRAAVSNYELLKNQDYVVTGRLEDVNSITNTQLSSFFKEELPKAKAANQPKVVINSADVKSLKDWSSSFVLAMLVLIVCLVSSIYVQAFIDKKLLTK